MRIWGGRRSGSLVEPRPIGDFGLAGAVWVTCPATVAGSGGSGSVSGRARSRRGDRGGALGRSGDERDALVGVEERVGGGPAVEDAHDVSAGAAHEAGGGVPERPAQRLGFARRRVRRCSRAVGTSARGRRRSTTTASQARLASMSTNGNRSSAGVLQVVGCGPRRGRGRACARRGRRGRRAASV